MQDHTVALHVLGAILDNLRDLVVVGIGEGDVADKPVLEEGEGTVSLGAVNDLVRDNEVHGPHLLLQGADGREADDGTHAQGPQGGDVRARRDLVGRDLVVLAVAGQEGDGHPAVLEDHDGGGRIPPWRQGVHAAYGDIAIDLVEAGAADDGNLDRSCRRATRVSSRISPWRGSMRLLGEKKERNMVCWHARSKVCGRSDMVVVSDGGLISLY